MSIIVRCFNSYLKRNDITDIYKAIPIYLIEYSLENKRYLHGHIKKFCFTLSFEKS